MWNAAAEVGLVYVLVWFCGTPIPVGDLKPNPFFNIIYKHILLIHFQNN